VPRYGRPRRGRWDVPSDAASRGAAYSTADVTQPVTTTGPEPGAVPPIRVPMNGPSDPSARARSTVDVVAIVALVGLGVILPLALAAMSGALLIPHNDDPSTRRVAIGLYHDGRIELNGWTSMTLVGQILLVQPFLWATNGGPLAFVAMTAGLASVGILAGYLLVRRILAPPRAILSVLGVLFFPGFLLNTTSFMTDVPAWATSITCLALGAVAFDRHGGRRWAWIVASLAVGCFAFSIREFAIAAPIAVLVVTAASSRGARWPYSIALGVVMAICAALYLYAVHLPGQHDAPVQVIDPETFQGLSRAFATLALTLSPAIVLAIVAWRSTWRRLDVVGGMIVGLLAFADPLVSIVRTGESPRMLVGNLLEATGDLGSGALAGDRPVLFRWGTWEALNATALVAAIVLLGMIGGVVGAYLRRVRRRWHVGGGVRSFALPLGSTRAMLATFAVIYGGGVGAWGLVVIMFDRYLWLLMLPLYALMLTRPGETEGVDASRAPADAATTSEPAARRRTPGSVAGTILAGGLVVVLGATSVALLLNGDAFDGARWRLGEAAVARGIAPSTVDAGLEWVAAHASGRAKPYAQDPGALTRYEAWWPPFHVCAIVSGSRLHRPDLHLITAVPGAYRRLLVAGPRQTLYLYRVAGPGC
jgi:hypothetical protein